ncbi:uncharacterized protein [Antedon mediterranea]|uniref:uncharacterized protein n=1 Tax=Antedon mediterranea TaxID=105859 RepID=UPI003AF524E4
MSYSRPTCVCPEKHFGLQCELECPTDCKFYGLADIECVRKKLPLNDIAAFIIKMNNYKPIERMVLGGYDERVLSIFKANNSSSLQALTLYNNQISNLPADIFNGLGNLLYLFLSYNQFSNLPAKMFQGLNNLQRL